VTSGTCRTVTFTLFLLMAFGLPGTHASAQASVRVAAYNIKHGRGMDDQVDLVRIADVLRSLDADVITLQEVDDGTERTGGVDQVGVLAELLGYRGVHGPHRPYQGGFYGNAVLSRIPIVSAETVPIPPAAGSALAVLEVVVEVPAGGRVRVVSVHLAGTVEERRAQAEALSERYADDGPASILAGDFNGRPDDAVVRRLAESWRLALKERPAFTYPADRPDREIDFVMWRDHGSARLVPTGHYVISEEMASDHRPIVVDFEVR